MFYITDVRGNKINYVESVWKKRRSVDPVDDVTTVGALDEDSTKQNPHGAAIKGYTRPKLTASPLADREPAVIASQIMSEPVRTLHIDDISASAEELFKARRFRHIPILNQEEKLVGILSDRDVFSNSDNQNPISNIMSTPVLSAHPDTEIRLIARTMFEQKIGAMPIIDDEDTVVGLITRSDILRTVVYRAPFELWI